MSRGKVVRRTSRQALKRGCAPVIVWLRVVSVPALMDVLGFREWVLGPPDLSSSRRVPSMIPALHVMLLLRVSTIIAVPVLFLLIHRLHPTLVASIRLGVLSRIQIIERIMLSPVLAYAIPVIVRSDGRPAMPDLRRRSADRVIDKVEPRVCPVRFVPSSPVRSRGIGVRIGIGVGLFRVGPVLGLLLPDLCHQYFPSVEWCGTYSIPHPTSQQDNNNHPAHYTGYDECPRPASCLCILGRCTSRGIQGGGACLDGGHGCLAGEGDGARDYSVGGGWIDGE